MSLGTSLILAIVLLALNAYFVAGEFAVTSSRRSRVEPLLSEGEAGVKNANSSTPAKVARAKTVLWALENVSLLLAVCQLGVTLCSIGLGAIAEPALAHLLEIPFGYLGLPVLVTHAVAVVLALLLVVYLHVVLGEMLPKNATVTFPEKTALWLVPSLVRLAKLLHPLIRGLNALANWMLRKCGLEPKDEISDIFSTEEVASIIERSEAEGVLQDDLGLLSGVIEFTARPAAEVMVPLNKLVTLSTRVTPQELEQAVADTGFSRFPLVDPGSMSTPGNLEDFAATSEKPQVPVGYLHIKDVLYARDQQRVQQVPSWRIRSFAEVEANQEVDHSLAIMQKTGAHMALVKNEQAQVVGVLFLEDIIEELVGEVRDSMQRR